MPNSDEIFVALWLVLHQWKV